MSRGSGVTDEQLVQAYILEKLAELLPDTFVLPTPADQKNTIQMLDAKESHQTIRVVFSSTAKNEADFESQLETLMEGLLPVLGNRVMLAESPAVDNPVYPRTYAMEVRVDDTPAILKRRAQENDHDVFAIAEQKARAMQK